MLENEIWIVEDKPEIGETLTENLRDRKLSARYFKSPEAIFEHIKTNPPAPMVVVLDMNLEHKTMTGLDVGQRLKDTYHATPPQVIIYSAYDEAHYLKGGFKIQADCYLVKAEVSAREVITYIRALVIRWALKQNWHQRLRYLRTLVWTSEDLNNFIHEEMDHFIKPYAESVLGTDFFFHLRTPETSLGYGFERIPNQSSAWKNVCSRLEETGILKLEAGDPLLEAFETPFKDSLANSVFIPLYKHEDVFLVLGLKEIGNPVGEDPLRLAQVIGETFKAGTLTHIFREVQQTLQHEHSRKELVELTQNLCINLSEQYRDAYENSVNTGKLEEHTSENPVKTLGEDLLHMGKLCRELTNHKPTYRRLALEELIQVIWDQLPNSPEESFSLEGSQVLCVDPVTFRMGIRQIMRWMVKRMDHESDETPQIKVKLEAGKEDDVFITLEDNSRRLPLDIRKQLFSPFGLHHSSARLRGSLDLFMAKMALEARGLGRLMDHTDQQTETAHGHSLRLKLFSYPGERES